VHVSDARTQAPQPIAPAHLHASVTCTHPLHARIRYLHASVTRPNACYSYRKLVCTKG
jgi:hypothetical protein